MDYLTVINQAIAAHRVVRGHLKLIGEAIPDKEALIEISRESPYWLPGHPKLAEKHQKLQQTLALLEEGLKNHFGFEEKYLPPLLGEFFTRALRSDHKTVLDGITQAKTMIADFNPLTAQEGVSAKQLKIHEKINWLREYVEQHATREDVMFAWLKQWLEKEKAKE